jgi:uncharacterized protein
MYQRWRWLTFLHWRYDPDSIRPFIPARLTLDIFDGAAWIGLVPFDIIGLRPPWAPPLPWISHFLETNVRTYVTGPDGGRGVLFFTLEAARLPAVMAARTFYHLPYRWASMKLQRNGSRVQYQSKRNRLFGKGQKNIVIEPGDAIHPNQLEHFLTARFRFYTAAGKRLLTLPIEHPPWPLQAAKVVSLEEDLIQNSGVPRPQGEPLAHYSADLLVKIGNIQTVA